MHLDAGEQDQVVRLVDFHCRHASKNVRGLSPLAGLGVDARELPQGTGKHILHPGLLRGFDHEREESRRPVQSAKKSQGLHDRLPRQPARRVSHGLGELEIRHRVDSPLGASDDRHKRVPVAECLVEFSQPDQVADPDRVDVQHLLVNSQGLGEGLARPVSVPELLVEPAELVQVVRPIIVAHRGAPDDLLVQLGGLRVSCSCLVEEPKFLGAVPEGGELVGHHRLTGHPALR